MLAVKDGRPLKEELVPGRKRRETLREGQMAGRAGHSPYSHHHRVIEKIERQTA